MRSKRVFLLRMIQCTSKAIEAILERFGGLTEGIFIMGYRPGI